METETNKFSGVRWMTRRDLVDALDIEARSFEHPWSEEEFLSVLRDRKCIGMAIEYEGRLIARMVYKLERSQITILNFATHPDFRRLGAGRRMLEKLKSKLNDNRRRMLKILVRETSMDALCFFKSQGFLAVEVQRGAFEDEGRDGILMQYEVAQTFSALPSGHMPKNRVAKFMI